MAKENAVVFERRVELIRMVMTSFTDYDPDIETPEVVDALLSTLLTIVDGEDVEIKASCPSHTLSITKKGAIH